MTAQVAGNCGSPVRLEASYVMPLRLDRPAAAEMTAYLMRLSRLVEVVVTDGSPPDVFAAHHDAWGGHLNHVAVKSVRLNGKVAGVVDGLAVATYDKVVIADDDVRYEEPELRRLSALLDSVEAVVPQNYFDPLPWHARWDTGRTLLNRAVSHDYAGTVGVRRSALPDGEYCGSVLFENLELLRTIRAAGGHVRHELGLYVRRQPPTAAHFWRQRVRQAYDSFAQPPRFAAELAVLPAVLVAVHTARRRRALAAVCALLVAAAERGRRRSGGSSVFAANTPLWVLPWVGERAVCSWIAVAWRLRGGIPYAGRRLALSAHRQRDLASSPRGCRGLGCACRSAAHGATA